MDPITTTQPPRLPPQLPHGSPTAFNGVSETFAFHSSPESFIASRVIAFQAEHGSNAIDKRPVVHAKILNRDVAVISSYAQVRHVLTSDQPQSQGRGEVGEGEGDVGDAENDLTFIATDSYRTFMAAFYPSPNLLLSDGASHAHMRRPWEEKMNRLVPSTQQYVQDATAHHFQLLPLNQDLDLYKTLKSLVWRILLGLILHLDDESDPLFQEIERLQEDLLRGQFSLMPVSVNVGIWQSPRSRGIAAKEKLRQKISERLRKVPGACPFHDAVSSDDQMTEEVANHNLLFTSSLAVKGIASLLTAYLLNIFLMERQGGRLIEEVRTLEGEERNELLRSIQLETERLSPPVVGIMRRVNRDTVIPSPPSKPGDSSEEDTATDVLIPRGWDAWLYFVGAGRDPHEFGATANQFDPYRYSHRPSSTAPESRSTIAFSMGAKKCLGQDLVRQICMTVANTVLETGLRLEGEIGANGVRAWLGWEGSQSVSPAEWARDMKQLPTQRPARPVMVRVLR